MATEPLDVVIVGAGLSGIAAAYYLQTRCPARRYAILEARTAIGGTWDLFRYPGVRSDSDMFTLGYSFRPWPEADAIAGGPAIRRYIRATAQAYGIDRQIRFGHRVRRARWSSRDALWTLEVERTADPALVRFTCRFLFMCTGYYDYAQGYTPAWPGMERFTGRLVHPQQWPEDLAYAGKRVIVIGSGATAVTLVPALAARAAHVTLLQRSPTYIVARPSRDALVDGLRRRLPPRLAGGLARWKSALLSLAFYTLARRFPTYTKRTLLRMVREELGPDYDIATHFTPRYKPWDQRLCLAPDGDLFAAIRSGRVTVVTGEIATFTATGLRLRSGAELAADVIVTATGLRLQMLGGAQLVVDGQPVDLARTMGYKGMMFSDVPNLALAFGYTNASWTLKCELTAAYVCRLLNYMARHGYRQCTPRLRDPSITAEPALTFTSGYVRRALALLPKQGSRRPWKLYQNYLLDLLTLRLGAVADGTMEFRRRAGRPGPATLGASALRAPGPRPDRPGPAVDSA